MSLWIVGRNFVEGGVAVCVVAAFFVLVEVLVVGFRSCHSPAHSWGRGVRHRRYRRRSQRKIIIIIRRCVVWSVFFISSVIVHVLGAQSSDGVTVASKSLSLSPSWYFGDVNSCLWLVKLAHALDAVIEHNLYFVFEGGW